MGNRIEAIGAVISAEVRKWMDMYERTIKRDDLADIEKALQAMQLMNCLSRAVKKAEWEFHDLWKKEYLKNPPKPVPPLKPGESDGYYQTGELKKVYTNGNCATRISK